jgi:hypothetical protein
MFTFPPPSSFLLIIIFSSHVHHYVVFNNMSCHSHCCNNGLSSINRSKCPYHFTSHHFTHSHYIMQIHHYSIIKQTSFASFIITVMLIETTIYLLLHQSINRSINSNHHPIHCIVITVLLIVIHFHLITVHLTHNHNTLCFYYQLVGHIHLCKPTFLCVTKPITANHMNVGCIWVKELYNVKDGQLMM